MLASIVTIEEKLIQSVQDYADDRRCLLELFRFLGKHPYTRFSRMAVVHALKNQGVLAERGLKYLVDKRLVTVEVENNIKLFSLTMTEQTRTLAFEMGRLDWCQWQSVLRQVSSTE